MSYMYSTCSCSLKRLLFYLFCIVQIEGFDSKKADDYQLKGIEDEKLVVWEYKPSNNGAGKNLNGAEGKAKGEQHRGGNKSAASLETDTQTNPKEKNGKVSESV